MEKPTLSQVAWVFEKIAEHINEGGGTFRYLIYERMGFGPFAYQPLYKAGGMLITNTIEEALEQQQNDPHAGCYCKHCNPKNEAEE